MDPKITRKGKEKNQNKDKVAINTAINACVNMKLYNQKKGKKQKKQMIKIRNNCIFTLVAEFLVSNPFLHECMYLLFVRHQDSILSFSMECLFLVISIHHLTFFLIHT